MTIARRLVVDRSMPGWYHCFSRCVRRAFLCGGEFEHRREWVQSRLMMLADVFAIEVAAYAVMSNHLHAVVHVDPRRAAEWNAEEVARRWLRLFCPRHVADDAGLLKEETTRLVTDTVRIEVLRSRLTDLSWFMRCLSEPIARRANREDRCTGRFWEGRFKCRRLLDARAVLACCVYTDLNPIRAGLATTPEGSDFTSVQDRIHFRHRFERIKGLRERAPRRAEHLVRRSSRERRPRNAEDGIWLAELNRSGSAGSSPAVGITLDAYLTLVHMTGRCIRPECSGSTPRELCPILSRLSLDADGWVNTMIRPGPRFGTAIGDATQLTREALRRGGRWIVSTFNIYDRPHDEPAAQ